MRKIPIRPHDYILNKNDYGTAIFKFWFKEKLVTQIDPHTSELYLGVLKIKGKNCSFKLYDFVGTYLFSSCDSERIINAYKNLLTYGEILK